MIFNLWRTVTIMGSAALIGLIARFYLVRRSVESRPDSDKFALPAWSAASWVILLMLISGEIIERYNDPLTLRTPIASVAVLIGLLAMRHVLSLGKDG